MTFDEKLTEATGTAAAEAKDRPGHRLIWVSFVVLMLGALALATMYFLDRDESRTELSAQHEQLVAQHDQLRALADQVRQLGAVPVVEPASPPQAEPATVDPAVVREAARTAVLDYCASRNQCRGPDGAAPNIDLVVDAVVAKIPTPEDGRDGRDAPTPDWAAQVAAYCGQSTEPCRGPAGENGESPPCMSEPAQCQGNDGRDGANGQPPAGWTTNYADGSTETCTRASPFDPASPRYECTRSAPPSTDPPLPLGGSR